MKALQQLDTFPALNEEQTGQLWAHLLWHSLDQVRAAGDMSQYVAYSLDRLKQQFPEIVGSEEFTTLLRDVEMLCETATDECVETENLIDWRAVDFGVLDDDVAEELDPADPRLAPCAHSDSQPMLPNLRPGLWARLRKALRP